MGNCFFFGSSMKSDGVIKVITSNGAVMELYPPVTVDYIINEFPTHAIFKQNDLFWTPLLRHEQLCPGQSYYLLPLQSRFCELGHVRSGSLPESINILSSSSSVGVAPYRMSVDYGCKSSGLRRSWNEGFWKVKLVINGEQLAGILAEAGPTEELIDNVRTVAKFRNIGFSGCGFSDKWSLSSSGNGSKNGRLLL